MDLLQLKYFQTVAKLESITKAAEAYHIAQPAMSQTITKLEKELGGIRLFDRQNNKLFLNDKGRCFLKYVDTALGALDDGIQAISDSKYEYSGNISMLVTENRRFVFLCVSRFSKLYPNVYFSITNDPSTDPLINYDFCVQGKCGYSQMNACAPLINEEIVLNVNENHWLADRSTVSLDELKDERFITMSSGTTLNTITYDYCRSCGFEPKVPIICDDSYFLRKYVAENMGVALSPSISWAGRFRSNTKILHISTPSIYMTSYLFWNDKRYISPTVAAFRDFLIEEAKKAVSDATLQQ